MSEEGLGGIVNGQTNTNDRKLWRAGFTDVIKRHTT